MNRAVATALLGGLARRGLMGTQLGPYEGDDGEWITPKDDPEVIAAAFEYCRWVEEFVRKSGARS